MNYCNKGKGKDICLTSRSLCNIYQTLPFPLARIARNAAATIDPTLNLCTRYPLLLGGQRQCGYKACPRLLHLTGASGIEPQTPRSRVPRLNRSATRSTIQLIAYTLHYNSNYNIHYCRATGSLGSCSNALHCTSTGRATNPAPEA